MSKCIRIAKASSTYLSSVSSTVHIFLLLIPICTWLWEIWDCLVLNHPKPNRTTSLQEPGGWETSGKGPSWEVSAVNPDCSPSSVGQTDEGGSVICFLLLQCRASHSVAQSEIGECSKQETVSSCRLLGAGWEMKGDTPFSDPKQKELGPSYSHHKRQSLETLVPLTNLPQVPCHRMGSVFCILSFDG